MFFPRAAVVLAIFVAPFGVLSQIVTITERPSSCSAIYTTGSSSVTVVQSTVTVAPIPFSDALVNAGAPFVIEVQPGATARRRQATNSTYISPNGRTTTNGSEAAVYRILNGTLQSIAGEYVSADESSDSALFALSVIAKTISTTFASRNLELGWSNPAFDDGTCKFYTSAAEDSAFDVIAYFRGIVDSSWRAVTFVITTTGDLVLEPTTSTTVSTVISMGNGVTATPAVSASTTGVPLPSSTGATTDNGFCGASAGICDGIIFGSCCSQYGACGNTDEYCGTGCQLDFGTCNPIVSSSTAAIDISSAGPSAPIYSATVPQLASSSLADFSATPIMSTSMYTSTSVFLTTSGSVTLTMTTMVPVTTFLPIYSDNGSPIGPISPPMYSSSNAAIPSDTESSSAGLPPSYVATLSSSALSSSAEVSSIPVVAIPSSTVLSVSVPSATSTAVISSPGPGTVVPSYSAPDATLSFSGVISSVIPGSSLELPLPSFYSSPAASLSTAVSSAVIPPILSTSVSSSSTAVVSPAASSCPGAADGTVLIDSGGEPYMIYCDSDYVDNLATPLPDTPSFDACLLACDRTEGCAAATYIAANTYCYLKPAGGSRFGTGGYVGVRVNGVVIGSSSSLVAVSSTPGPDPFPSTQSVPVLPTEESAPAAFSTTFTPVVSSTILPTDLPPVYSETLSFVLTTTSIPEVFSSTPLPAPVFSSTPPPDTYSTTSSTDATPSSTSVLVLTSPIRCDFGEAVEIEQDDSYCEIILPQPMVLYSKSSVNTFASTNGFLSIIDGATQYQNAGELPTTQVTEADNETPLSALFPFWDDLSKPEGEGDYGIYYQLSDTGVTYEYYLTRLGQLVLFHFTIEYTYSNPGVAVFTYYGMDDPGDSSTVGSQGFDATGAAVGVVYSYQSGTITPGLVVTCETLANTCVRSPTSA